jgi:hypothetical protein
VDCATIGSLIPHRSAQAVHLPARHCLMCTTACHGRSGYNKNFLRRFTNRSDCSRDKLCPQFSKTSDITTSVAAVFICSSTSGPKNLRRSALLHPIAKQRTYSGAPTVITLHFNLPLSKISCSTSTSTQWLLYVSNMPLSSPGAFDHLTHSFTAICSSALGL